MKKIGALYPIWNQELFLKPHLEMALPYVDRCVVLLQPGPLPNYQKHGIGDEADLSEYILQKYFPSVEVYPGHYPTNREFSGELYNEGLLLMRDCDLVTRFDPDMMWSPEDFAAMMREMRETEYSSYRMDFARDSINYYCSMDFDHGLKDAREYDPLAVDPKYLFTDLLTHPGPTSKLMRFSQGWTCHHFRGWAKPTSTPPDWPTQPRIMEHMKLYGDRGQWYRCPDPVRSTMQAWLDELQGLEQNLRGRHWDSSVGRFVSAE